MLLGYVEHNSKLNGIRRQKGKYFQAREPQIWKE
jgi:hypothetical protein